MTSVLGYYLQSSIEIGINDGMEGALAEICDGYDEPDERCPMRPNDGCACLRVRWRKTPFWRRWMMQEPPRPNPNAVMSAFVDASICSATQTKYEDRRYGKQND